MLQYWNKDNENIKEQRSSALDDLAKQKGLWINNPTKNVIKLVNDIDNTIKINKGKDNYNYHNYSYNNNGDNDLDRKEMNGINGVNNGINSNLRQYSNLIIKNGK